MNSTESHDATDSGPRVSLLTLLARYGESHRPELEALWAEEGTEHLVLFSDAAGTDMAILPVGPAREYRTTEAAFRLNIEGLRAVCHTPAAGFSRRPSDTRPAEAWKRWRATHPTIITGSVPPEDPVGGALVQIEASLRDTEKRLVEITEREEHADAMERRLDRMAHDHLVRLAELEQREHELAVAGRTTGKTPRPFDRNPPLSIEIPVFKVTSTN